MNPAALFPLFSHFRTRLLSWLGWVQCAVSVVALPLALWRPHEVFTSWLFVLMAAVAFAAALLMAHEQVSIFRDKRAKAGGGMVVRTGKPVMARRPSLPERNAPCPCGSGRKYKRCCIDGCPVGDSGAKVRRSELVKVS